MRTLYQLWFAEIGRSRARRLNGDEWLPVAAIVALGVALRWWSPAMKSDLWYDEVCSYTVAGRPFCSMMHTLYLGADTNPPLYTILLHFWLKLGASDTHVKVFSLLFATASIWVVYLLAKRLFGRRVGLISSCYSRLHKPSSRTASRHDLMQCFCFSAFYLRTSWCRLFK